MPRGRPILNTRKRQGITPPPERTCPTCFRRMELVDKRQGHYRWACPKHGEPKAAA